MVAPGSTARIRRILLAGLILGAVGLGVLYLFGRQGREAPEPVAEVKPVETGPDTVVSSEAFDFTQAIEGEPVFSIHGDGFSSGRDARVELVGVRIEIFRDGGRYAVASDRATYDPNTQEAELVGSAHLEGDDGISVRSPRMSLRNGGKLLVAEGPVALAQTGRFTGEASRLDFDVSADTLSLDGPVRMESAPGSAGAMTFETAKLTYDRKGHLFTLPEALVVTRGADRLQAGKGELFLADDDRSPILLALDGGVAGTMLDPGGDSPGRRLAVQATRLSVRYEAGEGAVPREASLDGQKRELALVESIGRDAELIQGLASRAWHIRFAEGKPTEAESADPVHFAEYRRGVETAVRSGRSDRGRIEFGPSGDVARIALDGGVVLSDPKVKASGDRALFDVQSGRAEILGPKARAESERGDLAAPHLIYTRESGVLSATGGVRAVLKQAPGSALDGLGWGGKEPVQVEAKEATLTDSPRTFTFRDSVRAWQGKNLLLAKQLRGDDETGRLSAAGGLKTVVFPESGNGAPLEVTAETLSYVESELALVYSGAVALRQEGRSLHCDELRAELDDARKIRRMIGSGNVALRDPAAGREVEGERAEYDAAAGTVLVTGDTVTMKDSQGAVLKGKRLQYDMNSGAAKMLGAGT